MRLRRPLAVFACAFVLGWQAAGVAAPSAAPTQDGVGAIGHLQPRHGVIRVAGPSSMATVVVARLLVETGQRVRAGQPLAELDTLALAQAQVAELTRAVEARQAAMESAAAELSRIEVEQERQARLHAEGVVSDADEQLWSARRSSARADQRRLALEKGVAQAALQRARVELGRAVVRAPCDAQVLRIHARDGEKIDDDEGLLELGIVDHMYAVAEVYETDLARVRVGQPATVTSPALARLLSGTVERIGLRVGKGRLLPADPMARADVRVVLVEVRLDDSAAAAAFTDLQVEVRIGR